MRFFALATLVAIAAASIGHNAASPVQKVIQLLGDLQAKIIKEGEAAQSEFQQFGLWCQDRSGNLKHELAMGKGQIEELNADIESYTAKKTSLEAQIEDLASSLGVNDADLTAATQIREKEKKVFQKEDAELADVVDSLQRAIRILEDEMRKGGSAALTQIQQAGSLAKIFGVMVEASMIRTEDQSKLMNLVQTANTREANMAARRTTTTPAAPSDEDSMESDSMAATGAYDAGDENYAAALLQMSRKKLANNRQEPQGIDEEADFAMLQGTAKAATATKDADEEDDDSLGAPDPATYKSHSNGIVDTLTGLLEQGKEMLEQARTKEQQSQHNFNMLHQSLSDEIKFSKRDKSEAEKNLHATAEANAAAKGDLEVTSKSFAENTQIQSTLQRDCMERSQEFEQETKGRNEELDALGKAKDVLSGKTPDAGNLAYGSASFLQLHESRIKSRADLANVEAVRYIRNLAKEMHSDALTQLARRMETVTGLTATAGVDQGGDPFKKVKDLIINMIDQLSKDAEADATHKAYCDKEMSETQAKKDESDALIAKLSAQIDTASARSDKLKEEVAALQKELADLAKSQSEMDKLRREEKEMYNTNKGVMDDGIEGVKMALKTLREYYETGSAGHASADGAAEGILGLLEVVESDFTKELAEMSQQESNAKAEYERETNDNQITRATKDKDVEYKNREAYQLDAKVREAKGDRESENVELSAVLEYQKRLHQMCVAEPMTYEERKSGREKEIAGLKEALNILSGESSFLQRQMGSLRRLRGMKGSLSTDK
jgi:hypothetical protein